jgi:regulator-associated protein of mTOR
MAGYSDSSIRLWRPGDGTNEAGLVTAWQGLLDFNTPSTSRILTEVGLVTAWHQHSQTIMAAGESKYIRLWDAERESKICDIQTSTDTFTTAVVTKLSCAPNGIFAAGCDDGTVRLFDKRLPPSDARIITFREHVNSILTICLRDDCEYLISACTTCNVKLFDIRKGSSYHSWNAGSDVTAMSIHTSADIIACASSSITIHGMDGTNLNTIRCNEGFMGTKHGLTSCLSFHRYKINLAAGFVNNSACVFATRKE